MNEQLFINICVNEDIAKDMSYEDMFTVNVDSLSLMKAVVDKMKSNPDITLMKRFIVLGKGYEVKNLTGVEYGKDDALALYEELKKKDKLKNK